MSIAPEPDDEHYEADDKDAGDEAGAPHHRAVGLDRRRPHGQGLRLSHQESRKVEAVRVREVHDGPPVVSDEQVGPPDVREPVGEVAHQTREVLAVLGWLARKARNLI